MRKVAVHFQDVGIIALQCPAKPGNVGRAQPLLAGAVHDVHRGQGLSQAVRDCAGSIGRVVVHHEHVKGDRQGIDLLDQRLQVLCLVVGWDDDQCLLPIMHWARSYVAKFPVHGNVPFEGRARLDGHGWNGRIAVWCEKVKIDGIAGGRKNPANHSRRNV